MFYLKYRPKRIADLDNSEVKIKLEKILQKNILPHAFLFIGKKGTGKTSTARILAKAVNCQNNKFAKKNESFEPCNQCATCLSIDKSSFPDVFEIDAASNRGIEEIKNIIFQTNFLPISGRFRIFIIDEAHMITNEGFNTLLKTLEEPPKTAIFILATTNPEKIPQTIASRCFQVNFGKARIKDLISMLKKICKNENLSYDEDVLKVIADHSEDSFRDAAKILEEVVTQNLKTKNEIEMFLGIKGRENFLEILEKKDSRLVFSFIEKFAQEGGSFKNLIEDILEQLRLSLLQKKGLTADLNYQTSLTTKEISLLIKLLIEAYQNLKITPIESLPLEIALAEFYDQTTKKNQ